MTFLSKNISHSFCIALIVKQFSKMNCIHYISFFLRPTTLIWTLHFKLINSVILSLKNHRLLEWEGDREVISWLVLSYKRRESHMLYIPIVFRFETCHLLDFIWGNGVRLAYFFKLENEGTCFFLSPPERIHYNGGRKTFPLPSRFFWLV